MGSKFYLDNPMHVVKQKKGDVIAENVTVAQKVKLGNNIMASNYI
jgi:hypothetical protein